MAHGLQKPRSREGAWGCSPLMGEQVELPIQLAHGDGLGVEHIVVDSLIHTTTDGRLAFESRHGSCQDSVTLGRNRPQYAGGGAQMVERGYTWRPR